MGIDYLGYGFAAVVAAGGIFGENSELLKKLVNTHLLHLIGVILNDVKL